MLPDRPSAQFSEWIKSNSLLCLTFRKHFFQNKRHAKIVIPHTLSLSKFSAVGPGKAMHKAQLPAHNICQVDVDLIITHRSPLVVVEHFQSAHVVTGGIACETHAKTWRGSMTIGEEEEEVQIQEIAQHHLHQ